MTGWFGLMLAISITYNSICIIVKNKTPILKFRIGVFCSNPLRVRRRNYNFYANACLKSSIKSAASSIPTLNRTKSSVIPISFLLSSGMEACVINAG